ncbi:MAG: glycosyltransferase family 4 protein, partial [Raoultibacter sp.]
MHDMRVLSISAQKPDSTGSGVFLAQTTEALLRAGHDTAVIAGVSPTDQPVLASGVAFYPVVFETDELPFPVVGMSDEMPYHATRYCDMNPAMVAAFRDSFECVLLRAVNEFDPDLIVCHHLYLLSAHVRMLVSDRVVIAVSHSTELRQMRKHDLERAAIVAGVRDLDLILALHAAQKREIIELFDVPEDKVQVIGTGYNDRMFCASPHASSVDAIEKPLTLAYAGKIWEKKGVPCLIRSLDLLPSEHDSCTLKLAGGYASEEEYRAFVELGAASSHSVEFLGKLTQTDLAKLYREASLFVLPS